MSNLFYLPTIDPPVVVPETQYGKLEYGCPSLEYMRGGIGCHTIEHAEVLYQGKLAHLFFDEEGLLNQNTIPNDRATALLANKALARHPRARKFVYNDVLLVPPPATAIFAMTDRLVVGIAYLWTGGMDE